MSSGNKKFLSFHSDKYGETSVEFKEQTLLLESSKSAGKFSCSAKKPIEIPYKEILTFSPENEPAGVSGAGPQFLGKLLSNARRSTNQTGSLDDEGLISETRNSERTLGAPGQRCALTIDYFLRRKSNPNIWLRQQITLSHTSPESLAEVRANLRLSTQSFMEQRPKRLLFFINPYGGARQAEAIFEKRVKPLVDLVGIEFQKFVTKEAQDAHNTLLGSTSLDGSDLDRFDGVIGVGGDGILNEIFNALIKRTARENQLDVSDPKATLKRPALRIGVVPGGSTDSVASSLHGTDDVDTAILHILLGDERSMDVNSIYSINDGTRSTRFSITMVSYGYFGDLIQRSENYRWMGPKRYNVSGTHTFLQNQSYKGTVEMFMSDPSDLKRSPSNLDPCTELCECQHNPDEDEDHTVETVERGGEMVQKIVVTGEFMVVTGACIACCCRQTPKGVSPGAHHGDGNIDLILVKKTSRLNYGRYLIRTSLQHASPFDLPFVEAYRVKEFKFSLEATEDSPIDKNARSLQREKSSVWNCDGEIIKEPNIHVKVNRKLITVYGRGPAAQPAQK